MGGGHLFEHVGHARLVCHVRAQRERSRGCDALECCVRSRDARDGPTFVAEEIYHRLAEVPCAEHDGAAAGFAWHGHLATLASVAVFTDAAARYASRKVDRGDELRDGLPAPPRPVPDEVDGYRHAGSEERCDAPCGWMTAAVLTCVGEDADRDRRSEHDGKHELDRAGYGHLHHNTEPMARDPLDYEGQAKTVARCNPLATRLHDTRHHAEGWRGSGRTRCWVRDYRSGRAPRVPTTGRVVERCRSLLVVHGTRTQPRNERSGRLVARPRRSHNSAASGLRPLSCYPFATRRADRGVRRAPGGMPSGLPLTGCTARPSRLKLGVRLHNPSLVPGCTDH